MAVLGNLLKDYGKTIAAHDRTALCGRVEASQLRNGKMSIALLCHPAAKRATGAPGQQ